MTDKKTTVSIRFTYEDHKALKLYAVANNITIQDLIHNAVQKVIEGGL